MDLPITHFSYDGRQWLLLKHTHTHTHTHYRLSAVNLFSQTAHVASAQILP